jgi:hypothetical protein
MPKGFGKPFSITKELCLFADFPRIFARAHNVWYVPESTLANEVEDSCRG